MIAALLLAGGGLLAATTSPGGEPPSGPPEARDTAPPADEGPAAEPPPDPSPAAPDEEPPAPAEPDPSGTPPDPAPVEEDPGFAGTAGPLPSDVRGVMTGVSWRPGCPVALDDLALLELSHWGFDGRVHTGQLVVAARVADPVLDVFARLFAARFPIERMELVDAFDADDDRSMAANNTHAFNCRPVEGTTRWSQHAYGTAIDVNPVQNPYVRAGEVLPPAGAAYLDRSDVRPGMIVRPGPAVDAFDAIGWGWGGDWTSVKDYHHFSESGR